MRYLFASLLLALVVSVSASLPAAAEAVRERSSERWSEGVRFRNADQQARPHRRVARAGNRSYRKHELASRSHYAKRKHTRVAKHTRRQRTARKPGIQRSKTVQQRQKPAERTASAPVVTKPEVNKGAAGEAKKRGTSGTLGMASFYWQPQALASGGRFNPNAMTAAHKTLPFGTRVRVTHLGNGRSVEVKINDRGPYIAGRIIDLSKAAAGVIGMTAQGVARVAVEILGK